MGTLLLVRHGESEGNSRGIFQGRADFGLTPRGREQARELARWLQVAEVAAFYASPLSRARETADLAAGGRPVQLVDGLMELDVGRWQARAREEVLRHPLDGPILARYLENPGNNPPPEGESLQELQRRAGTVLAQIKERHPRGLIVVVTHGMFIRSWLCRLRSLHLNRLWEVRVDNASLTPVAWEQQPSLFTTREGRPIANLTCHLRFAGI